MYGARWLHNRDQVQYYTLFEAFSVELQQQCVVYMNLQGQVFTRNKIDFARNFTKIADSAQDAIIPKAPLYEKV